MLSLAAGPSSPIQPFAHLKEMSREEILDGQKQDDGHFLMQQ
jgi:hypothetical protein